MTIHRVGLTYSEAGAPSFNGWLSQWLTNMQPWEEWDNTLPTLTEPQSEGDPPTHYRGQLCFAWSEDESIITDQLAGYLGPYCDWHQLEYHVCSHDEAEPTPCEFEVVSEGGAIPDGV